MRTEKDMSCCKGTSREHKLVEKYIWAARRHRTIVDGRLSATGVYRGQHQLLMYVSDHPNASQKELAEHYRISTASVAVSLKRLEKGGYIQREVDQKDNRYNQICLTEKGKQVVKESAGIFQEIETAMFYGFSQEDFDIMEEMLDRIYENLEDYSETICRKERKDL